MKTRERASGYISCFDKEYIAKTRVAADRAIWLVEPRYFFRPSTVSIVPFLIFSKSPPSFSESFLSLIT